MAILADAALDERERELLGRFVAAVEEAYGDDLDAVWLYGSRAGGSARMTNLTSTCSLSRARTATTRR